MKTGLLTFILLCTVSIGCVSCGKSVDQPVRLAAPAAAEIAGFRVSGSSVVLLEGNANSNAVTFNWAQGRPGDTYTIEADVSENHFSDPLVLGSTTAGTISFTVKEFNALMSQLLCADNSGRVDFRVRTTTGHVDVYSQVTAMNVTTYRSYVAYDDSRTIKVPGNFQGWSVPTAPKIVSAQTPGEYEGYINFANPAPQVLLVRGNQWDLKNTFTYIGNNMFGYGGSIIDVPGGSGIYLFRASTNTNRWSSYKINSWNLVGNAVTSSTNAFTANEGAELSWSITTDLSAGTFRINANNAKDISFGHKTDDQPGVPSYDGADLRIKSAGNYTITLKLSNAGNYAYTIRRNG